MSFAWQSIHLKDFITLYRQNKIDESDFIVLNRLYLPIIGIHAYSVYMYFAQFVQSNDTYTLTHQQLLNHLNIGMHDFYYARLRLEAIGLIKTYQNKDNHVLEKFIIEVLAPKTPQQFLSDAIYCGLLVDMVGQKSFDTLTNYYLKPVVSLNNYQSVSVDFYKIYGKNLSLHTMENKHYIGDEKSDIMLSNEQLDWEFLMQLLGQTYIHESLLTIEVRNAIQSIYQLYNLSPLELKEVILRSHHVATNKIVVDTLFQIARQIVQSSHITIQHKNIPVTENESTDATTRLINLFNQTKSSDFLKMIKDSKNKMHPLQQRIIVQPQELKLLEQLIIQQNIPMPVVNVLIHHVLVTLSNNTLHERYVSTIANDWINAQIGNAQEAMNYLKTREGSTQDNKTEKIKVRPRKSKYIKEIKMSDAEKNALHDVDMPMTDSTKKQQLMERLGK